MKKAGTLAAIGEAAFLRRLLPRLPRGRGVLVGPGDDCALVRGAPRLLLTEDAVVEGSHFRSEWLSAEQIGARASLVSLSDIAAMGGRPLYGLVSVGVPPSYRARDLEALHKGVVRALARHGASLVGGNLCAADRLFVSLTLVGEPTGRPARRNGAQPGHFLFVTGTLGDAALGLQLLQSHKGAASSSARALMRRFVSPTPRLEAGRALAGPGLVSAMIDVSDGLLRDVGHLCEASGVDAVVLERFVPRSAAYRALAGEDPTAALCGGEDYELVFTVAPGKIPRLGKLIPRLNCRVTFIGRVVRGRGRVWVQDRSGRLVRPEQTGFDHFAKAKMPKRIPVTP